MSDPTSPHPKAPAQSAILGATQGSAQASHNTTAIDRRLFGIGLLVACLVPLFSLPVPFFWDSILLGSQTGQHFLQNGLTAWILPEALDAGHPPFFGWYLALWWTVLGATLPVAHLAMLPVLVAIWWQFYRFLRRALPGEAHWIAASLLLLEPTFAAQAIHVGPDLVLLAAYLWGLNSLLDRRPLPLAFALLLLCAVSLRGCFAVAALFFTHIWLCRQDKRTWWFPQWLAPFTAATGATFLWLGYHGMQTGWFAANPDGPWAANQGFSGLSGMARNLGLVVWRLLDFGRLVLWVPGALLLATSLRQGTLAAREKRLLAVFVIPLLVFTLAFLPFRNPIAHRYLLTVLVLALPWFAYRIYAMDSDRQKLVALVLVAMLGFGHRWIYPDKVAQGWDASLAHVPYFSLLSQAQDQIPNPEQVYTGFPVYKPITATKPGSQRSVVPFRQVQGAWTDHDYVLYSNIINDISDEDYNTITSTWPLLREWSAGKVFLRLYRRPGVAPLELPEVPEDMPVGGVVTPP